LQRHPQAHSQASVEQQAMRSRFLTGLSSIAILAFVTAASAQTASPAPQQTEQNEEMTAPKGPADNQIANDVDARIAQLKSSLRLTADQEKNWSGVQTALHDFGILQFKRRTDDGMRRYNRHDRYDRYDRYDRRDDRASQNERPDDIALMRKKADRLTEKAESLKTLANAAEPLYRVLDDRQKQKLMRFMSGEFEFGRR
jgi:hypothetical protein